MLASGVIGYFQASAIRIDRTEIHAKATDLNRLHCKMLDRLKTLAEEKMTMICATDEMAFVRDVSDRIAYFRQGAMAEIGRPEQIFGMLQYLETQKFLSSVR